MHNTSISENIRTYVTSLYQQNEKPALLYHNIAHTEYVVNKTFEIAGNYNLDETEILILCAAAWFHDTGHLFGETKDHEKRSVFIVRDYLQTKEIENKIIDSIDGCIMATKLPHNPTTLLEEIICDADTYLSLIHI